MDPERFIPLRKTDVARVCARDPAFPAEQAERFETFARLCAELVHFEHRAQLEALKDAYAVFDPDPETRRLAPAGPEDRDRARSALEAGLRTLLSEANFTPISSEDLAAAFEQESLFRIRLAVDFDDFDQVLFFARGATQSTETIRTWLGLRRREVRFTTYSKVVVFVTFKDAAHFAAQGRSDLPFEPGATHIKLFQRVPRADLEMLLPNTEVRLRPVDKLLIGVPALVSGVVIVATKLVASLGVALLVLAFWLGLRDEPVALDEGALLALGAGLGSLGGYLWKQFTKFKNRKIQFMKALTDNLYFRNLDNDAGVFHHLLDAAEEEEVKEMLLAYRFLLAAGPLDNAALDEAVQRWFADRFELTVDFDVEDGLAKLDRFGLAHRQDGGWAALPLDDAIARIDRLWDDAFDHAGLAVSSSSPPTC